MAAPAPSAAAAVYEVWTCERIHARKTAGQVFKAVVEEGLRPPVPPDCPLRYAALMQACWEEEPGNRWVVVMGGTVLPRGLRVLYSARQAKGFWGVFGRA